jgi:hypothetical protein
MTFTGSDRWAAIMGTFRDDTLTKPVQLLQKASAAFVAGSANVSLPSPTGSGNTLLLAIMVAGNTPATALVQTGFTWVKDKDITHGSNTVRVEIWRASDTPPGSSASLTVTAAGAQGGVFLYEYSGLLNEDPIDQSRATSGSGNPALTGITGALTKSDDLLFSVMGFTDNAADFQKMTGFYREDQDNFSASGVTGAVLINNESFKGLQYQGSSETAGTGDFAGAIVAYKNDSADPPEQGTTVAMFYDEDNQDGTADVFTNTSFQDALTVIPTVGRSKYLVICTARFSSTSSEVLEFQLKIGSSQVGFGRHLPLSGIPQTFGSMLIHDAGYPLDAYTFTRRVTAGVGSGSLRQASMLAIKLDSINLFEGRDWLTDVNESDIANLSNNFADNQVASVRLRPDGTSSYIVLGHAELAADTNVPTANEGSMRIRDRTNNVTLATCGWHKERFTDSFQHPMVVMAILDTPTDSNIELGVECIGGGGANAWDHKRSAIVVLRLEAFHKNAFGKSSPRTSSIGGIMQPTTGADDAELVVPFEADDSGDIICMAYGQCDNTADETKSLANKAQYPGLVGDRSLQDSETATEGGAVIARDTNAGTYDINNTNTRIPLFQVTKRNVEKIAEQDAELFFGSYSGPSAVLEETAMALISPAAAAILPQPVEPPVDPPVVVDVLEEKDDHEEEALANLLEQFKP